MRLSRGVLVCFLIVSSALLAAGMNDFAQDPATPPQLPSLQQKAQALTALTEARGVLFPLRRSAEARQVLARIAPLLAIAGDTAGAQEVLALLPVNQRDALEPEIVDAQLQSGDVAGALQTAVSITTIQSRTAALLLIVKAQGKSRDFDGAMRTVALIGEDQAGSAQGLMEMATEEKNAGKREEAMKLLRRATTAASSLTNSNEEVSECGLSVLARIAEEQESLGEAAEALKTLRLAEGRVQEAAAGCRYQTTGYLRRNDEEPEALQNEIAGFREKLAFSNGPAETDEEEAGDTAEVSVDSPADGPPNEPQPAAQARPGPMTREQTLVALDSLRRIRPPALRAQAAMGTSQMMFANGKTGEAEEAIHIGLEAADTLQDENVRGMLLTSKAHARAVAKDWEGARAIVEEISNAPMRTFALADIAFCAAEAGRAQTALSWATAEASPISEASVLVSIAEALLHQPRQAYARWLR